MAPPPEADGDDPLSYRAAGVDIEAGQRLVERIKPAAQRTRRCEVLSALGGFGALFELPLARCSQPVLVAGADGVGTKLALARQLGGHRGVGIDLVAMCVNDILTQGAEPLFFLDYFASGKLDVDNAAEVVEGIADGCQQAGAALIGGETAEMPGMYAPGDYDLAGFAVGVVDKPRMLDAHDVRADDVLIGLASSGPHSNGYSLIRRILADQATDLNEPFDGATLGQRLLEPTRIYVEALLPLLGAGRIKALAHITGGGLTDNLPRVLPAGCAARVEVGAWPRPEVFAWLKQAGRLAEAELLHTFNCGIGMVAITAPAHGDAILERAQALALPAWPIGRVIATEDEPAVRYV